MPKLASSYHYVVRKDSTKLHNDMSWLKIGHMTFTSVILFRTLYLIIIDKVLQQKLTLIHGDLLHKRHFVQNVLHSHHLAHQF